MKLLLATTMLLLASCSDEGFHVGRTVTIKGFELYGDSGLCKYTIFSQNLDRLPYTTADVSDPVIYDSCGKYNLGDTLALRFERVSK